MKQATCTYTVFPEIECMQPLPPRHGYITGGEWIKTNRHFYYLDEAKSHCAYGYLMKKENLEFSTAVCLDNGKWSQNISNVVCESECISVQHRSQLLKIPSM